MEIMIDLVQYAAKLSIVRLAIHATDQVEKLDQLFPIMDPLADRTLGQKPILVALSERGGIGWILCMYGVIS